MMRTRRTELIRSIVNAIYLYRDEEEEDPDRTYRRRIMLKISGQGERE